MGTMIDSFFVSMGLDTAAYDKSAAKLESVNKKIKESTSKMAKDVEHDHKDIAESFSKGTEAALTFFAAVAGGVALKHIMGDTVTTAAATGRLAQNFGMATSALSGLQSMMAKFGGTADDANSAVDAITQGIMTSIATGNPSDAAQVLTRGMGINVADPSTGAERKPEDIIYDIADWMKAHTPQQDIQTGRRLGFSDTFTNALEGGSAPIKTWLASHQTESPAAAKAAQNIQSAYGDLEAQGTQFSNDVMAKTSSIAVTAIEAGVSTLQHLDDVITGKKPVSYLLSLTDKNVEGYDKAAIAFLNKVGSVKNNNPLNLEYVSGQYGVKSSDGRFGVYGNEADGVTAAANQLRLDQSRGGKTLAQLITKWAPPSENDTAGYIKAVSNRTGINPNAPVDLNDPRVLAGIMDAMAVQETGKAIAPLVLAKGVNQALGITGQGASTLDESANTFLEHLGVKLKKPSGGSTALPPNVESLVNGFRNQHVYGTQGRPTVTIHNHVGAITVHTKATDAKGTADAVSYAVQKALVTNSHRGLS